MPLDENGEPPAEVVDDLTRRLEQGLAAVTLQADSMSALDLIERAERIFSAAAPEAKEDLAGELVLRKRFVDGYAYLRERDPALLAHLESRITRFEAELDAASLEPHELAARRDVGRRLARAVTTLAELFGTAG